MSVQTTQAAIAPPGSQGRDPARWHALEPERVVARLESGERGLTEVEAQRRLERYGPNLLKPTRPPSALRVLWDQARSLVVLLLFVAVVGAWLVGDRLEAAAIAAVLALNIGIGFWMEWRARLAMEALRRMQVHEAVVLRGGLERRIDASTLVPGDLIVLEAGAAIAADARIVSSAELRMIEAPLTGESVPVEKSPDAVESPAPAEEVPLAERTSMVYKGTLVAAGSGRAVVVGTGRATEIGRIQELVQETEPERTPLERRLDALGRRLVAIALGTAAIVSVLGLWRGGSLWPMIETGIALAIAAVPEGLPVVATITLAVGMRRMARRHALVRRLPAVETLGSTTVVAADKTGTLTAGEMTVQAIHVAGREVEVTGSGYARAGEFRIEGRAVQVREVPDLELALRIGALVNRARLVGDPEAHAIEGDPTEAALLVAARKAGMERDRLRHEWPEVGEVPFSHERRWMATFHVRPDGATVAYVKGAPDQVLERSACARGDASGSLDDAARERWRAANHRLAERGLRVLAVAERQLAPDETPGPDAVRGLTLVALVGMIDPPAPGVRETIARLQSARVRTVMITGDQAITAAAVARELGLVRGPEDETLDGRVVAELSDEDLVRRVGRVAAFSRVSPEDKLRIVRAYQARGDIVGMLGDGVNDAPALRRADIGVAMGGRGTDVAKETADVVLQDDRFETIGVAVEQGRVIFDNIRKFILYLFSCNLSEVLVLLIAGLAALPLPLLPLQILWLNLITDVFPALALAMEPAEPDVMDRPPRDPESAILSRPFLALIGGYGLVLTASTLGVFLWGLLVWEVEPGRAVTLAFMTLGFTQLVHVFNARARESVFRARRWLENGWIWGAIGLTTALQLAAVYWTPLAGILRTHPLGLGDWGLVAAGSLLPLAAGQGWKLSREARRRRRAGSAPSQEESG